MPRSESKKRGALAKTLVGLRARRGLSQRELASKSGIHHVTIAKLESGERATAQVETLKALALALGEPVGTLVDAAPSPNPPKAAAR